MENPVIILGAGGLGKAALDIFESNNVQVYCFLDDDKKLHETEIKDISVLGSTNDEGFLKYIGKKCEAFVAEDENKVRKSLVKMLKKQRKVMPVNAIHANAVISKNAQIGHGNFIGSGTSIGPFVKVGSHCLLHSGSIVDFETRVGDFVQIGAGSVVNSGVTIEDEAFVGSGVTIVSGVTIGKGARIGAGSVIISDVGAGETYFGNPAKKIE